MEDIKIGVGGIVAIFVVVAVLVLAAVFGVWLYQQFEADLISREFENIQHSQAFVETTNSQMRQLITEYSSAEAEYTKYAETSPTTAAAYQGQMQATLNQMRALAGTLDPSEVAPDIQSWLNSHQ